MNDIYHPKDGCELKSAVRGRAASKKKVPDLPAADYDYSSWWCDCTDNVIRRVDAKHPHVAISREGWFCMGCLNEFVMKNVHPSRGK